MNQIGAFFSGNIRAQFTYYVQQGIYDYVDAMSMATVFDNPGIAQESQVIGGDSGSAVFHKVGTQWQLIGIVNLKYFLPDPSANVPSDFAPYGGASTFVDLTYYRTQ